MRLVVDTNILVSALLAATLLQAPLILLWRQGRFELRRVTRYPKIRERLVPALAGRLVNDLRTLALTLDRLPVVEVSKDHDENYLLAIAEAESADFLLTGDKRHRLAIASHGGTKIITVRDFLVLQGVLP